VALGHDRHIETVAIDNDHDILLGNAMCNWFRTLILFPVMLGVGGNATAGLIPVTWFAPTQPGNSNANFPTGTLYSNNFGVAFQTGPGSGYAVDWVSLLLNTSTVSGGPTATVKLSLRDTTNATAYSAVAGSTEYAVDTLSFQLPTTTSTNFTLALDEAQIPNIANYVMSGNTAYALILYDPSVNFGMGRQTGYALNTTNNYYTVGAGFTALDTFRNNTANYSNNANSFPTLSISFGSTQTVPVPSTLALAVAMVPGWWFARRRRQADRG
jgi:hypothetical protein